MVVALKEKQRHIDRDREADSVCERERVKDEKNQPKKMGKRKIRKKAKNKRFKYIIVKW